MTIFEEIAALDRPLVDVKLKFGAKELEFQAQRPNALEADAIEAYYNDEYARIIIEKTEDRTDELTSKVIECDLNQMRAIYKTKTREELTNQLLQTRLPDIQRATMEKVDFNPTSELLLLKDMSEEEREAHFEQRKREIEEARKAATEEIRAEYDVREFEELAELCAQINTNLATIAEAQRAREAIYLYFVLKRNGERVYPSPEAIRENLQPMTIQEHVRAIEKAFAEQSSADLPFVSPGETEPGGQPTSANPSEPGTTQSNPGGKRTRKTRGDSKPSTTHAD